jgi:DNA polymerase-1
VDKGFLNHLVETVQDPMAKLLLKHKNLSKLKGTYLDGIYNLLDSKGRVHTKFNQDIARTGRLSSSEPNL